MLKLSLDQLPAFGFFVEIGAHDGEINSYTSELADKGWKGLYVEPIPEFYERCRDRHLHNKNIEVKNCAVGPIHGKLKLFESGQITTAREDVKALWEKEKMRDFCPMPEWREVIADMITMDQLVGLVPIDLLVIDTEGMEADVLSTLKTKPKMVVIELHAQSKLWEEITYSPSLYEFFTDYDKVAEDDTDTLFVRK